MNLIFASVQWQIALGYLKDIVVFSKWPSDHIEQTRRVVRLLYEAGVTLNLKICKFFTDIIHYVEQVIRLGRL